MKSRKEVANEHWDDCCAQLASLIGHINNEAERNTCSALFASIKDLIDEGEYLFDCEDSGKKLSRLIYSLQIIYDPQKKPENQKSFDVIQQFVHQVFLENLVDATDSSEELLLMNNTGTSARMNPSQDSVGAFMVYAPFLAGVYIPTTAKSTADCAFPNHKKLSFVYIPPSLEKIGDNSFQRCSELTSIYIHASITDIGIAAFANCQGLISVYISSSSSSLKKIPGALFKECKKLSVVNIPPSVTDIGDMAFYGCNSMISIVIPPLVTSIGDQAFHKCENLVSLVIPASVTTMGTEVFDGCNKLTFIHIMADHENYERILQMLPTELQDIARKTTKAREEFIPKGVLFSNFSFFNEIPKELSTKILTDSAQLHLQAK